MKSRNTCRIHELEPLTVKSIHNNLLQLGIVIQFVHSSAAVIRITLYTVRFIDILVHNIVLN